MKNKTLLKITLLLAASLTVMSAATISPSLPMISEQFKGEGSVVLTKLILTMSALFIALSGLFSGAVVHKFGRLKVLNVSLILYAIAGSSGYWARDLYTLLVGRAFLGIAVGGIMTVISTLVGDYFQGEERNKFFSIQGMFMSLGGVVFVSLGGFLADINWRMPFTIYLLSLVVLVFSLRSLYEPAALLTNGNFSNHSGKTPVKTIAGIFLCMAMGMLLFYLIPVQLPFLLNGLDIQSATLSGIAIAISTVGGAAGAYVYAYLKKKFQYRQLFAMAFFFMAIGYIFIGFTSSYLLILVSLLVSGFGVGFFMPNGNLWLLEITPLLKRSTMMGLFTSAVYVGQFVSPLVVQPVVDQLGLAHSIQTFGYIALVCAPLQFVIFKPVEELKSAIQ